ncbi:MAG: lipopolysaccharide biosynthesis protein, partial [Methanococcaceae archaeon]
KEKLKELTKDTAIYGISTIVSRFLSFLLVPFYTNVFATGEYGIQSIVFNYIAFLNIIYIYGMDSSYLKFASLREEGKEKDVFSTPYLSVLFSSVVISAVILFFRNGVNSFMEIPPEYSVLAYYFTFILFFDALTVIPFAHLRIMRKAKKFAAIKTINIVINVLLNIILLLKFKLGLEGVFISNLAASFITFLLLLPDILRNLKFRIEAGTLKNMLRFGITYLPAGLASMVIQVIDRPILQRLTNESVVGIYQANYKMGIFMMLFVSMFQYAWQPFFLNNAKEKDARQLFSRVLTYFTIAGSFILILLSLFIDNLVRLHVYHARTIMDEKYWSGLPIIPVILLGYLFNGIYINFTAGIFIREKTKYIPYITGAGALVNIAVNYLLIPYYGMMGAALATLASYLVMSAILFFVTQRFYKIEYEYSKIARIFTAVALTGALYYIFDVRAVLYKLGLALLFALLLYIFRVISREELGSIKRLVRR